MSTETLFRNRLETLRTPSPLAQLEGIIEATAATLSPDELAILNAPNQTPSELQLDGPETTTEATFDGILRKTPEILTPGRDHTMKVNIVKEGDWQFKAW